MNTFVGLVVLLLSLSGWCIKLKERISIPFIPALLCAGISVFMTLAGVLNMLQIGMYALLTVGIVMLIKQLVQDARNAVSQLRSFVLHPAILFFIIIGAITTVLLWGSKLYNYDDFSHWGTIVRSMQVYHRLPNFLDESHILFQSYPPGMACFIYFFCEALGCHQALYLPIQALYRLCCIVSLFSLVDNANVGRRLQLFWISVFAILLHGSFLPIDKLWVDAPLGLFTIVLFMMIFDCKRRDTVPHTLGFGIALAHMLLIKNSGLLFTVGALITIAVLLFKGKKDKKALLMMVLMSVTMYLIWQRHVAYVFHSGLSSKHALSLSNYIKELPQAMEHISAILKLFIERTLSLATNPCIYALAVIFIIDTVESIRKKINSVSVPLHHYRHTLWSLVIYGAFLLGVFGMYCFSMPFREIEAGNMRDYYCYSVPCAYLLWAIAIYAFIGFCNRSQSKKRIHLTALALLICAGIFSYNCFSAFNGPWHVPSAPERVQTQLEQQQAAQGIDFNQSIAVIIPDEGFDMKSLCDGYTIQYTFLPQNKVVLTQTQWQDFISQNDAASYAVVYVGEP